MILYPGVQGPLPKLECSYSGKRCNGFWFNILLIMTEIRMTLFNMKPFLDTSSLSIAALVLDCNSLPSS